MKPTNPTILAFAGSTRRDSVNKKLARLAAAKATSLGAEGVFLDIADYEMPLYDGDIEREVGIPEAANRFAAEVERADALIVASPEYNGAFSPVLKNSIDWATRVERRLFRKPTALMSGTPGSRGGVRGLAILRATLENMAVPVIETELAVPEATLHVEGDASASDELDAKIETLVAELISATVGVAV